MSYGSNKAWGLQAVKTLNSATWNGQTNPYFINPLPGATQQSIFKGDPVALNNDGFVVSLYEIDPVNYGTTPILGVFDGCSYVTSTAVNPIDPASPARQFWPAGTRTLNDSPVIANIIDDPSVIYNIQTNGTPAGLTQTNAGNTASVAFSVTAGLVDGNTLTGTSLVTLDQTTAAQNANLNLKIIRLVTRPDNFAGEQFNNVEVLIQNHFYCSRPAGV